METRDKIRRMLELLDWKQAKLARKIGESDDRVSRWLSGTGLPDANQAVEIAEAFGVSLYWLCDKRLGMEDMATYSAAHLSTDEREVLKVYRATRARGLDSQGAIQALIDRAAAAPDTRLDSKVLVPDPPSAASRPQGG